MNSRRVRLWAWLLVLLGAGCTAGREAATPLQAAAPAPATPACPESIAADAPLEADYGPRIHPRHWLPALAPSQFAFVPNQLYLDVKLEYVNRLRLGPDGHFVQAVNKR